MLMLNMYPSYLCKEIDIYLLGEFFLLFQNIGLQGHDENFLGQPPSYVGGGVKSGDSLLKVAMDWEIFHCLMQYQTTDFLSTHFLSLWNKA